MQMVRLPTMLPSATPAAPTRAEAPPPPGAAALLASSSRKPSQLKFISSTIYFPLCYNSIQLPVLFICSRFRHPLGRSLDAAWRSGAVLSVPLDFAYVRLTGPWWSSYALRRS